MPYYTIINGQKHDASLIINARFRIRKQGDGRISKEDAQQIWLIATDGGRITEFEENTLNYILENFNFTEGAKEWLTTEMEKGIAAASSYYQVIDGLKYDRAILDKAKELTAGKGDGRISKEDATFLLPLFQDAGDIRIEEERTMHYVMEQYKWTEKAKEWFLPQFNAMSKESAFIRYPRWLFHNNYQIPNVGFELDTDEILRQTLELRNKLEFNSAIAWALSNLFRSREPNSLAYFAQNVFQLEEAQVEEKIRELLNNGKIIALPDESSLPEDDQVYGLPPNGERVDKNWIFGLEIPDLGDNYFWAIISRDAEQTYNYGGN
jgi:hypothetical protein